MATLIPAIGSCVSRMTSGERRTAERWKQQPVTSFCSGWQFGTHFAA